MTRQQESQMTRAAGDYQSQRRVHANWNISGTFSGVWVEQQQQAGHDYNPYKGGQQEMFWKMSQATFMDINNPSRKVS